MSLIQLPFRITQPTNSSSPLSSLGRRNSEKGDVKSRQNDARASLADLYNNMNDNCCTVRSSEFRSCVKVEVAVLGSPSLMVRAVSVDGKRH